MSTFDLQPKLRGRLLELRPLRTEDYEAVFAAASDPLIWEQHPDRERHKPEVFKDYFQTGMDSSGAFAIIDNAPGASQGNIIGSSRYWNYKPDESEIEIGWTFLERKYWGGEYNRELKLLMVRHAFRFVERIVLVVGEHNLRSQRAVEKLGAVREKVQQRPGRDGIKRGNVVYLLTRADLPRLEATLGEGQAHGRVRRSRR